MIDPEAAPQDPADTPAAAPAAPLPLGYAGQHPVSGPGPAIDGPRGRRPWRAAALALVVVAGLAAGLMVWAPWIPPPVLRPAGLTAGPAAATSVTLRWSRPATGPLPDRYVITGRGTLTGAAPGGATSYRQVGLNPASTYQFRVVAVRGGKRSPTSAPLTLSTVTPPVAQARLQGTWIVTTVNPRFKNFIFRHKPVAGLDTWFFTPVCVTGACDVTLSGLGAPHSHTVKLTRAGASYQGQTVDNTIPCGQGGNTIPDPLTLKIRLHVTAAAGKAQIWAATSWTGTVTGTSPYVSSSTFYCPAGTISAAVSGTSFG